MAFDSRVPAPPPIIPGVTDTGEAPQNPMEMLSKFFSSQPALAEQHIQQAILSLREAARLNPAMQPAVGQALRSLMQGKEPQAGSPGGVGGGQSTIIGSANPTAIAPPPMRNP